MNKGESKFWRILAVGLLTLAANAQASGETRLPELQLPLPRECRVTLAGAFEMTEISTERFPLSRRIQTVWNRFAIRFNRDVGLVLKPRDELDSFLLTYGFLDWKNRSLVQRFQYSILNFHLKQLNKLRRGANPQDVIDTLRRIYGYLDGLLSIRAVLPYEQTKALLETIERAVEIFGDIEGNRPLADYLSETERLAQDQTAASVGLTFIYLYAKNGSQSFLNNFLEIMKDPEVLAPNFELIQSYFFWQHQGGAQYRSNLDELLLGLIHHYQATEQIHNLRIHSMLSDFYTDWVVQRFQNWLDGLSTVGIPKPLESELQNLIRTTRTQFSLRNVNSTSIDAHYILDLTEEAREGLEPWIMSSETRLRDLLRVDVHSQIGALGKAYATFFYRLDQLLLRPPNPEKIRAAAGQRLENYLSL